MSDGKPGESKKLVSRREFLVGGGAVMAALALAACGTKTSSTTTPGTSTPGTSTPVPITGGSPTAQTPKYGGTLRYVLNAAGTANIGWPPEIAASAGFSGVNQDICETLLRGDNKGNAYPWLAESFKVADDLTSITFNLRKGVKFHDGSDFNADVVKWNLENYIPTKSGLYGNWDSVDKLDDFTVRVNFNKWVVNLPMSFAEGNPVAPMVSKAAFEKNGIEWMREHPVGTGPFVFDSYTMDVNLNEKKNPNYWLQGKPYLDGLNYLFVTDTMTAEMLMQSGSGDAAQIAGPKTAHDYDQAGLNVTIIMEDNQFLVPDTANPDSPFANKNVREAVEYAIDKEAIAKGLGYGYWVAPYQVPSRASAAYDPNFTLGRKYNLEKAKQLMSDAGYGNGFNTKIHVGPFVLSGYKGPIQAVQADLAKIGINADLDFPDMGKWAQYMGPGTWEKGTMICNPVPRFDASFLGGLQMAFGMTGSSWLRTPEMMTAYQAVLAAPSVDVNLIRAVTNIITRDASLIPICEGGTGLASQKYAVAGFNERAFAAFYNSETFWLNK